MMFGIEGIGLSEARWLLDVAILVYWVGVSLLLITEDREPSATLAWLLVLFSLPIIGLLLYFFFGRNWPEIVQRSEKTQRVRARVDEFMPGIYAPYAEKSAAFARSVTDTWVDRLVTLVERKSGAPVLPARTCAIFESGAEYFDVLIADLASAERFIHLNYFIWGHDDLTARIVAVLHDRLAAGVEVRILNDFVGSIAYSKDELKALAAAGAHVSSDVAGLARVNYRNHRKITVVDSEIGHSGGFNIGQEYIDGGKRFGAWRDTGIRITGPAVADLEKLFDIRWLEVNGEDLFQAEYYPDPALPAGDVMVQTVHQGFDERWNAATRAYQTAIAGAKDSVLVQSPYFVPDQSTLDALINTAASGVRVDFMMTLWPDKKVPYWAAESYFEPLLAAGGRIWLWEPGFFHAKTLTVDGEVCAIGTMNMDMRSLRINKELMVWVYDREIAERSEAMFDADLAECREVTLAEVQGWSRGRRFRNSAMRLASHLL